MSEYPLFDHQKQTSDLLQKTNILLDASDPGTGKTRAAIDGWLRRNDGNLLVVAPKSLLQAAWEHDITKFYPELIYSIAWAHNRKKAFDKQVQIYITNTDAVKWIVKQPKNFFIKRNIKSLIVDESTYFKHRTSQRSKALIKLIPAFKYRQIMTGTPRSKTILDLWNQIKILDGGKRLGTSFYKFRNQVCVPVQNGPDINMVQWIDKPNIEKTVISMIKDIIIRHPFDAMNLPENYIRNIDFHMSSKHMKMYRQLEKDSILKLEETKITAVNKAVLRNKLLQSASGAVYYEDSKYKVLDESRYELILDLIKERKHSLVFFNWTHQKELLIKKATRENIPLAVIDGSVNEKKRKQIVDEFQKGKYQVLFLHPQTGGHGLTLTKATTTILCSPIYQADYLKQIRHRIWRKGQTQKTETITISAVNTIEPYVYSVLNNRTDAMINLLDLVRLSYDSKV